MMGLHPPDDEDDEGGIVAEINVTPLTDVFLVLLIIFMVTAAAATDQQAQAAAGRAQAAQQGGLQVDLPRAADAVAVGEDHDVEVWIGADGSVKVGATAVDAGSLRAALRQHAEADPNTLVIVKADKAVDHGRVVAIMDVARQVGLSRIAIATQPDGG